MKSSRLVWLGLVLTVAGCASGRTERGPAGEGVKVVRGVSVTAVEYKGFGAGLKLSNGEVEAVVVPGLGGRVMWFGAVGGENVLWENPRLGGKLPTTRSGWTNFGGDKVWPWPQTGGGGWAEVFGSGWPPPMAFDQVAFEARVVEGGVEMTGPAEPKTGLRVVRRVTLPRSGRKLVTSNRMEVAAGVAGGGAIGGAVSSGAVGVGGGRGGRGDGGGGGGVVAAPWTVTQLPWADWVRVEGHRMFSGMPPETVAGWAGRRQWEEGGVRVLELPGTAGPQAKVGADRGELRYRRGGVELVMRVISPRLPVEGQPEALQVYRPELKAGESAGPGHYVELEAAGLPVRLTGSSEPLVVEWELR